MARTPPLVLGARFSVPSITAPLIRSFFSSRSLLTNP
jgi:hypothetical protein